MARSVLVGVPEAIVGWMNVLFLLVHELVPDTRNLFGQSSYHLFLWQVDGAAARI